MRDLPARPASSFVVVLAIANLISLGAEAEPHFLRSFGRPALVTPATFGWITGIGVDSITGDVYVQGSQLKRFDADGNFILAFGSCGGCGGMDVNLSTHDVYAADQPNYRIVQYTRDGAFVRAWGSPGNADGQFFWVWDVAVDSDQGELYVIDGTRVQVFDLEGNFRRSWGSVGNLWGQFSGQTNSPYGITFDPATRTVWVSDPRHDRIQAFDELGTFLAGWDDGGGGIGPGEIRWVRNIDVDSSGNVHIADSDNERIQVFDASGSFVEEFRGPHDLANGPFHPRAIAVNRNTGEKYVAAAHAQRVDKFGADNSYLLSWGDREHDGPVFWNPLDIAVAQATGDVFVRDAGNFLVKRFSWQGDFINQWGGSLSLDPQSDGSFGFDADQLIPRGPLGLATDGQGLPWLAGYGTHYLGDPHYKRVRRFDLDGNFLLGWLPDKTPQEFHSEWATGMAIDQETGEVYVADAVSDEIRVHDSDGSVIAAIPIVDPGGIALRGGLLYVVVPLTDSVRKYDTGGNLLAEWGGPGSGSAQFNFAWGSGVAVDAVGKVYVADTNNHRIQIFDADGAFEGEFGSYGSESGQFRYPWQVAVYENAGILFVLENGGGASRVQSFGFLPPPCSLSPEVALAPLLIGGLKLGRRAFPRRSVLS
jgi:tripartite motif-containing protein 71